MQLINVTRVVYTFFFSTGIGTTFVIILMQNLTNC